MAGSERQIVRDYRKAQKQKILAGIAAGTMTKQDLSHFNATNRRHQMFDAVKAVVRLTQRKNPYTETGNRFERDGMQFENKGRIMIGGTKPMYQYQDSKGQVWLMKEAITAIGTKKPMGALVSEAAFRIQNLVEPESAIPTFVRRSADGKVVHGSFQARVDVDKNAIDLFQWQRDGKGVLTDSLKKQILREHVTDWLLCNFDTKGENFLIDTDGRLRGIDKEQAFSYLYEKEAQHLSYDYSPNPNKTLYDTVFQMYANGDKNMDLDLGGNYQYIRKLSQMPDQEYMNIFRDVIDAKCKGDTAKADKMYEAILGRKQNLETEYGEFYGKLVRERFKDKSRDMLTENGQFSFEGREAGAPQRIAREASRAKQSRGAEAMKERLEERRKVFLRSRNEKVSAHYQAIHDVLGKITELAELDVNRENRDKLEKLNEELKERCESFLEESGNRHTPRGRARRRLVNELLEMERSDAKTLAVLKDDKMMDYMEGTGKKCWEALGMGRKQSQGLDAATPVATQRLAKLAGTDDYGAIDKLFGKEQLGEKDSVDARLAQGVDCLTEQSLRYGMRDILDKKQLKELCQRVAQVQKALPDMEKTEQAGIGEKKTVPKKQESAKTAKTESPQKAPRR